MSSSIELDYPKLTDDFIESSARALLDAFLMWSDNHNPVPVRAEVIAEQFLNYTIDITDQGIFSDPECLGGIIFDENLIKINSSVESHEGRYNFTIAHEIGHHVLHKDMYLEQRVNENNRIICREAGDKPLVEQQADRFAAALLMPKDAVSAAFALVDEGSLPTSTPTTKALRALANKVVVIGGFSNVSNTAMVNRLIDLGLVSGAKYQTGTPQDFLRKSPSFRWVTNNQLSRTAYKLFCWVSEKLK
ncbi:ImmA/IrrE family metallo-endopeptidase [Pseudomonadales bacterium]|nr:ImmA/IrrE family metallo-endopeptidase [Pseudomonadales bacterium]MDC3409618.1 ImmA/IrrE family metallo-endopeptidase [bacterium]